MSIDINNESGTEVDEQAILDIARFALDRMRIHPLSELSVIVVDVAAMSVSSSPLCAACTFCTLLAIAAEAKLNRDSSAWPIQPRNRFLVPLTTTGVQPIPISGSTAFLRSSISPNHSLHSGRTGRPKRTLIR